MDTMTIEYMKPLDTRIIHQFWKALTCSEAPEIGRMNDLLLCNGVGVEPICLTVQDSGNNVGMICAVHDTQTHRIYIHFIGVLPSYRRKKVATRLLASFEKNASRIGIKSIVFRAFPMNYLTPGVDVDNELDVFGFLTACGYTISSYPVAMKIQLEGKELLSVSINSKFSIHQLADSLLDSIFEICKKVNHPDWIVTIQKGYIERHYSCPGYVCLDDNRKLVGFACFGIIGMDDCRFGPIGVDPEFQGYSIGKSLLLSCLKAQKKLGCTHSYFLWGDEDSIAEKMYVSVGFETYRRMAIFEKSLVSNIVFD